MATATLERTVSTGNGAVQRLCKGHNRDNSPCGGWAMVGSDYCKEHGGYALKGIAHPNYKSGRYSESGPLALRARVAKAASREDALNQRPALDLLDARIEELIDKLPDDEEARLSARSMLAHLSEAQTQYRKAGKVGVKAEDAEAAMQACWAALEGAWLYQREVTEDSILAADTWGEIYAVLDTRRKTSDSEVVRIKAAAETLAEDKARVMFGQILHVIRQNITDRATLQRIQQAVRELAP